MRGPFFTTLIFAGCGIAMPVGAAPAELPANDWSRAGNPTAGPPEVIGFYAHGCLAGAEMLPPDGTGYEVIRLSRRRNYGHPDLVAFVRSLGARAAAAGLPRFFVGDMAQPRGGPLPYGHLSHQTGLDADIWFTPATDVPLPPAAREEIDLPSMISEGAIRADRFGLFQVHLLALAAADARVERIFVNPVIKRALCQDYGGARDGGGTWLGKLTPWYGHDDHFHVRLACPAGSPACQSQPPPTPGDGCGAALADWFRPATKPAPKPAQPAPPTQPTPHRALPAACGAVLAADRP